MKILVAVLGLVLGIAAGFGIALANPMALFGGLGPMNAPRPLTRTYHLDEARGAPVGVAALLGLARPGAAGFRDPANRNVRMGVVVLPAGDGMPAALAVRTSVVAEDNSLWQARLGVTDYFNIGWPGTGSVFAIGYGNYWKFARDQVWSVARGGKGLAASYPVSALPPPGQARGVIGASGRYAGAGGDLRQVLAPRPDATPEWTLTLALRPLPAATP